MKQRRGLLRGVPHARTTGVRVSVIALVALVIGVIVAGCGGSSSTSSTGSTSNAARETAFLNYAQCMRQHGVAVSDPTVGANGTVELPRPTDFSSGQTPTAAQRAQMQTARTACSSNLKGITFGLGGASNPAFQAALLKYAQCMRTNGYNMPDPTFNSTPGSGTGTGGTGARGAFGGLNRNSPTFQKANTACRPILQSAGFGGGGGGGGGGFGGGGGSGGTGGTSGGTLG